jgi:hypothetical protein
MSDDLPRPAKVPCGSCPYRRDVPSAVWDASEYRKLPEYDGPTWAQKPSLFLCHQQDGHLCAGWLACHGTDDLLALRFNAVHESAYNYQSPVPVFSSGAEACKHGMKDIDDPSAESRRVVASLTQKRLRKAAHKGG